MFSSAIDRFNEKRRNTGEVGEDAGFTLIELMVVLLILAILLAIAIPTFLGVTKSANDRAAQSNLNTALLNAKAIYQTQGQTYTGLTVTSLTNSEPSLTYTTSSSTAQGVISVFTSADGNGVVLTAFSAAKNCWILADNTSGVTATPISATTYTNATAPGTVPVTQGTEYGEIKNTTAATCNSASALTGASYLTTGFPSL
jgi:type IV pilus assembly protein PilA